MSNELVQPPAGLIQALRRLLRPLARLLIANQIGLPYLIELLKGVYLEAAERHFRLQQGRMTDSRLSLLTGVHRKDVKRLRNGDAQAATASQRVSLGARLIGLWSGRPEYLDEQGRPRALSLTEFEEMVQSISRDVRPRTVLDEWRRLGYVTMEPGPDGPISLRAEALVPDDEFDDLAFFLGRNLHDHIAAASENLLGVGEPHLERAVYYPGLSAESVAELRVLAKAEAMRSLQRMNQAILQCQQRDTGREDADRRFCFGVYVYQERMTHSADGESAAT
jgi:hypothetical protein